MVGCLLLLVRLVYDSGGCVWLEVFWLIVGIVGVVLGLVLAVAILF